MAANFELKGFPDDPTLSAAAARDWLAVLQESAGPYSVALSGGRIAKTFFAAVADLARKSGAPLNNVHFFWADERCVAPSDAESNFRLAQENLFRPLGIAADKIHRLKGELPGDVAAVEASEDIRRAVPSNEAGIPVLDMVFLGMGENGHIASLMPNATRATLESREPYVHVSNSPKPPPNRLTMTYPVLAAAKNVWALVPAAWKEEALRASLRPDGTTPFSRILQSRRQTVVYTTELNEIGTERSK